MTNKTVKTLSVALVSTITILSLAGCSLIGGSQKPSKKELVEHSVEIAMKDEGAALFGEEQITKIFECLYDSVYDEVSEETLNKILDTENSEDFAKIEENFTAKEKKAFDDSEKDCEDVTSIESSTEDSGN